MATIYVLTETHKLRYTTDFKVVAQYHFTTAAFTQLADAQSYLSHKEEQFKKRAIKDKGDYVGKGNYISIKHNTLETNEYTMRGDKELLTSIEYTIEELELQ